MKRILLQLTFFLLSSIAFGQTTIENFAYGTITGTPADTITNPAFGGSVWRRHSGTTGQVKYLATSLTYTGYPSSNIGGAAGFTFATGFAQDINRSTTAYSSGTVYVSFLLNMSAGGGAGSTDSYFFHVMDTSAITAFRARHYIKNGSVANTFKIGIGKTATSTPAYSTLDYPLNTTILVVMKYKFDPVNPDSLTEYIFTSGVPSTEPAVPTLIAPDIITAPDLAVLNAVAIRQHPTGSTMSGIIDGIRVSDTWANSALPVKFISFNGLKNEDGSTTLNWSTSSEINNKGFEVEASSNGKEFTTIGFVEGMGNSNAINRYEYQVFENRVTYFRLKQIDFDGQSNYSEIISVKGADEEIQFSPNPFSDKIQISTKQEINLIEVIDMTGKVVISQIPEANQFSLNTTELLSGIYFVKIYNNESVVLKRIIKSN